MSFEVTNVRYAHGRRDGVVSAARQQAEAIRAHGDYSADYKRRLIEQLIATTRRDLAIANGHANGAVRAAKAEIQGRRAVKTSGSADELLYEQRLGRHLDTLRRRLDSGGLQASALRQLLQDASDRKDAPLLSAVEELLPEMSVTLGRMASGPRGRFAVDESTRLGELKPAIQQIRESWKSPEERAVDAAEAEFDKLLWSINQERIDDAVKLAHLEVNAGYYMGEEGARLYGEPVTVRLARKQLKPVVFTPAGESEEVQVGDQLSTNDVFRHPWIQGRTAEQAMRVHQELQSLSPEQLEFTGPVGDSSEASEPPAAGETPVYAGRQSWGSVLSQPVAS